MATYEELVAALKQVEIGGGAQQRPIAARQPYPITVMCANQYFTPNQYGKWATPRYLPKAITTEAEALIQVNALKAFHIHMIVALGQFAKKPVLKKLV